MKKRKIAVLIGLFACALLALGLAGCEHEHTYGAGWTYDATHHWHEATCEHSGERSDYAEHTWDSGEVTTPATCTEAGEKTYTCTVCSATKTEVIAATGHSYAKDWSSDNTHHWHEATCEHTGEKDGYAEHTWNSGTVTTPATCTEAGEKTYTCTVCSATKTEVIAATGHSWDDGEVTVPVSCLLDGITTYTCTACNSTKQETVPATGHVWNDGEVTTPAGCLTDGTTTYTCTACSATRTETIAATGHILEKEWTTDDTHHWHKACEHNADKNEYGEHTYNENNVCTVCGMGYVSAGLVYTLSEDGTYYSVTNIGTCTDTVIYIPSAYNGLPVKEIGRSAFYGKKTITGVVLPDGITTINAYAFYNCSSLASVTIPDSVTSIGSAAFYNCSNLASVTIGNGVTTIGGSAFSGCSSLESITIPDGVTSIGNYAFSGCSGLTSVTFANPKGWSRELRGDVYGDVYQSIPYQHLENASMAATFLRKTYCACDWRRTA